MGFLSDLPLWVQALFATLFTYAMTAAGAVFVFLSKNFKKKIFAGMVGLGGGIMNGGGFFFASAPGKGKMRSVRAKSRFYSDGGFFGGRCVYRFVGYPAGKAVGIFRKRKKERISHEYGNDFA